MPLDRANVTVASRIMLPTYVGFFALLGLNYLLTPLDRLRESPGLNYADDLLTIRVWGLAFLAAAVLMIVALVAARRLMFQAALAFCGVSMAFFAAALALAAVFGHASPTGWTWPAFVVLACRATYRSLDTWEA